MSDDYNPMQPFTWRPNDMGRKIDRWLWPITITIVFAAVVVLFSAILYSCVTMKECPSDPSQEDEIPDQIYC
jgi:hypothetical protein